MRKKKERKDEIIFVRATATQRRELTRLARTLDVSEAECVREGLRLLAVHAAARNDAPVEAA